MGSKPRLTLFILITLLLFINLNMACLGSRTFADAVRCRDLIRPDTIDCLGLQFNHRRIGGDGNCLFRSIAFWVYDDEECHNRVRNEVVFIQGEDGMC